MSFLFNYHVPRQTSIPVILHLATQRKSPTPKFGWKQVNFVFLNEARKISLFKESNRSLPSMMQTIFKRTWSKILFIVKLSISILSSWTFSNRINLELNPSFMAKSRPDCVNSYKIPFFQDQILFHQSFHWIPGSVFEHGMRNCEWSIINAAVQSFNLCLSHWNRFWMQSS